MSFTIERDLFEVLYEDKHLFAINKPPGIHSVALSSAKNRSVAGVLLESHPALKKVADKIGDAGLVNRLDFETSGILLGAKDRESWKTLRELIQSGGVFKSYLAIVEGRLKAPVEIEGYIGSENRNAKKMKFLSKPKKRYLYSHSAFEPIKYFADKDQTYVKIVAPTARRHQIRVHASKLGHPLAGDTAYGSSREFTEGLGQREFFLHAKFVRFSFKGRKIEIAAP